jgi:mannose/fructose/N-acetylgalactosamine-specific phosphotransferase system component IIC
VPKVRGLLVRYLVASGTFHSGVAAMEAIVLGFFGSSFLGNLQLGFLLGGFGVQVFWLGSGS